MWYFWKMKSEHDAIGWKGREGLILLGENQRSPQNKWNLRPWILKIANHMPHPTPVLQVPLNHS